MAQLRRRGRQTAVPRDACVRACAVAVASLQRCGVCVCVCVLVRVWGLVVARSCLDGGCKSAPPPPLPRPAPSHNATHELSGCCWLREFSTHVCRSDARRGGERAGQRLRPARRPCVVHGRVRERVRWGGEREREMRDDATVRRLFSCAGTGGRRLWGESAPTIRRRCTTSRGASDAALGGRAMVLSRRS